MGVGDSEGRFVQPMQELDRALRSGKRRLSLAAHRLGLWIRHSLRPFGIERWLYRRRCRRLEPIVLKYRRTVDRTRLLADIACKNLVFTVTAGRSGTQFVHKLFEILPDTTSLHEPDPAFHRYLRRIQHDRDFAREFLLNFKLPAIRDVPTRNYAELSHVFCKGFLEPLLELGITPKLVLLRRKPRAIALSYLEAYTVPGRTALGLEYLLSPDDPGVLPLPGWQRMSDYQLLFWYALEITRRQLAFACLVAQRAGLVCEATADELHDADRFFALVETLGLLDPSHPRSALAGQHAVIKAQIHNRNRFPMRYARDLDAEEEEVWRAVSAEEPDLRRRIERRFCPPLRGPMAAVPMDKPVHRSPPPRYDMERRVSVGSRASAQFQ